MKTTLPKIQATLQAALTYIRPGDIFLTGFIDLPPDDVMLPAIGIKDGQVSQEELAGGMMRYTLQTHIVIWTEVLKERDSLTGNAAVKGILDIEADVNTALDENNLGDSTIIAALPLSPVGESVPVTDGNRNMQRKELKFAYIKETARPSRARQ